MSRPVNDAEGIRDEGRRLHKYGKDYVLTSVTRDSKPDSKRSRARLRTRPQKSIPTSALATPFLSLRRFPISSLLSPSISRSTKAALDPGTHTDEKRRRYDNAVERPRRSLKELSRFSRSTPPAKRSTKTTPISPIIGWQARASSRAVRSGGSRALSSSSIAGPAFGFSTG